MGCGRDQKRLVISFFIAARIIAIYRILAWHRLKFKTTKNWKLWNKESRAPYLKKKCLNRSLRTSPARSTTCPTTTSSISCGAGIGTFSTKYNQYYEKKLHQSWQPSQKHSINRASPSLSSLLNAGIRCSKNRNLKKWRGRTAIRRVRHICTALKKTWKMWFWALSSSTDLSPKQIYFQNFLMLFIAVFSNEKPPTLILNILPPF